MRRVTGIGGVFFKARDPQALQAWYAKHLGIPLEPWGGAVFPWDRPGGMTVWCVQPRDPAEPAAPAFTVNYTVEDLDAVLAALREEGCAVDPKVDDSEYGRFGWVTDPEGNRVELWQPPA